MMFTDILNEVAKTSKRTEKEALLRQIRDQFPGAERFLKLAYDTSAVFYVIVDEPAQVVKWDRGSPAGRSNRENWWDGFGNLCQALAQRLVTGHEALRSVDGVLNDAYDEMTVRWACRILNKDLCAGFSASTINKVWPGLIAEFEVALAKPYDPDRHDLAGSWIGDGKMDGNRVVIAEGVAYSRNGKIYSSFPHIVEELRELSHRYLIDGEMMASGKFDENSGKLRRKDETAADAIYNVFDLIPIQEWKTKKFVTTFKARKVLLQNELCTPERKTSKLVKTIDWFTLPKDPTSKQLCEIRDKLMLMGFEGVMLKNLDAVYQPGRSDDLLKLKRTDSVDGRIVDVQVHRKKKDWLGAVMVEVKGVVSKCGSGFTQAQRIDLWKRRAEIIDKVIMMEVQEMTPDGSLRFPVFIDFRPDKD